MMEAILSFETSVLTKATRRNIPGDGILYSHRCENLQTHNDYDCTDLIQAELTVEGCVLLQAHAR
jgi:hypothetical protein